MTTPIGILLSGRGSNFLALHGAMERGEVPGHIAVVISNVAEAAGLEKARAQRLATVCIPHRLEPSREAHEAKVIEALHHAGAEWVCLAGYMRLLSASFVAEYPHGVRVSGCTVHLVDEGLDSGPIVVQRVVALKEGDTAESLSARILVEEHKAYPEALNALLSQRWNIVGRRLVFS